MSRGYFAVGIYRPKFAANVGALLRSARAFGAQYTFTIEKRYGGHTAATDTTKSHRHIPHFDYSSLAAFKSHLPIESSVVGIEVPADRALIGYVHPTRAIYLLGAEDYGLSDEALAVCHEVVNIDTNYCLNVAVAGAIVMHERTSRCSIR